LAEAALTLRGTEIHNVTASIDAVVCNCGREPVQRRPRPWLLTTAVLLLIYQQVPPPFGVTLVHGWLHYAIWGIGSLLLARYLRDNARSARTLGRRATATLRKLRAGFQIAYGPARDQAGRNAAEDQVLAQEQDNLVPDRSSADDHGS
jgi:hypothetical protein